MGWTDQPTDQPTNQLTDRPIKRGEKSRSTQLKIASINKVFTLNQMSLNRVQLALWKPVKIFDQRNLVVKSEMLLVKSGDRNVVVHCMLTHYENKLFQRKVLYWRHNHSTKKKRNKMFFKDWDSSNVKNIAKSTTVWKLCERSSKWDHAGCSVLIR